MARIKLETYLLRIRSIEEIGSEGNTQKVFKYEEISNIGLEFLVNFIDSLKEMEVDTSQLKTLQALGKGIEISNITEGVYAGLIEAGSFGVASKGKNIDTGEITYNKTTRDSDLMPHYFLFYLPPNKKFGAVVLQRFGSHGISTPFKKKLKQSVKKSFPEYTLDIDSLVPSEVIKAFIKNGEISEIKLIQHKLPDTIEDYLKTRNLDETEATLNLKLKKKNPLLNNDLLRWIDNSNSVFISIPNLSGFDEDSHKMSIRVKNGGTTREVDFSDTMKMKPYFDIDEEVEKDKKTKFPELTSIHDIAVGLIKDIFSKEIKFQ